MKPKTCETCWWAETCEDGLFCTEKEKPVEPTDTCERHTKTEP